MADQKQLIKEAEARFETEEPKVLSPKRSAFLNRARKGGGGCDEVVLFVYLFPRIAQVLFQLPFFQPVLFRRQAYNHAQEEQLSPLSSL